MAYTYTLSDNTIIKSYHSTDNFYDKFTILNDVYDFIDPNEYTAFSDEFTHEYLNEKVIVGCLQRTLYSNLASDIFASAHRLFCTESKTSFVYVTGGFWQETPSFLHEKAFVTFCSIVIFEE